MTLLENCSQLWGGNRILRSAPSITNTSNCFYLPYAHNELWGVFHSNGDPVYQSVDYRGQDRELNNQKLENNFDSDKISELAPAECYFYVGRIYNHYGHFIINTLPRFWALNRYRTADQPILCHAASDVSGLFNLSFIKETFSALGLSPDDFVRFEAPTRISNLVVPSTSLEEQRSAHWIYGDFCREIGNRIIGSKEIQRENRPVYFSKSQLRSGVGAIINEIEIDSYLRQQGIDVCFPEELNFRDQIKLVSERTTLLGSAGSFLHTSVFSGKKNIGCLNVQSQINSNYTLIDDLSENRTAYLYPTNLRVEPDNPSFLTARFLPNAQDVSEAFFKQIKDRFAF